MDSSANHEVSYIKFENLEPFNPNTDLLQLIRDISDKIIEQQDDWQTTFWAINDLRRVRKFLPSLFKFFFPNTCAHFAMLIVVQNTPLNLISLILTEEIFSEFNNNYVSSLITNILPKVLLRSLSATQLIRRASLVALKNVQANMLYPEAVEVLLEFVKSRNQHLSSISFECLVNLLDNFDAVTLEHAIQDIGAQFVFETIYEIYSIKKEAYEKRAFALLYLIQAVLSSNEEGADFNFIVGEIDDLSTHKKIEELIRKRQIHLALRNKKRQSGGRLSFARRESSRDFSWNVTEREGTTKFL